MKLLVCQGCGASLPEYTGNVVTCEFCGTRSKETHSASGNLLARAFLILEYAQSEEEFCEAQDILKTAAKIEPKNALVYVGLLMAELTVQTEQELARFSSNTLNNSTNYKKALRFADEPLKVRLEEYAKDESEIIVPQRSIEEVMNDAKNGKIEEILADLESGKLESAFGAHGSRMLEKVVSKRLMEDQEKMVARGNVEKKNRGWLKVGLVFVAIAVGVFFFMTRQNNELSIEEVRRVEEFVKMHGERFERSMHQTAVDVTGKITVGSGNEKISTWIYNEFSTFEEGRVYLEAMIDAIHRNDFPATTAALMKEELNLSYAKHTVRLVGNTGEIFFEKSVVVE